MDSWEVAFRLAPSQGGRVEKVLVEASSDVEAITVAALKLDDKGKDRWTFVHCHKVTS